MSGENRADFCVCRKRRFCVCFHNGFVACSFCIVATLTAAAATAIATVAIFAACFTLLIACSLSSFGSRCFDYSQRISADGLRCLSCLCGFTLLLLALTAFLVAITARFAFSGLACGLGRGVGALLAFSARALFFLRAWFVAIATAAFATTIFALTLLFGWASGVGRAAFLAFSARLALSAASIRAAIVVTTRVARACCRAYRSGRCFSFAVEPVENPAEEAFSFV